MKYDNRTSINNFIRSSSPFINLSVLYISALSSRASRNLLGLLQTRGIWCVISSICILKAGISCFGSVPSELLLESRTSDTRLIEKRRDQNSEMAGKKGLHKQHLVGEKRRFASSLFFFFFFNRQQIWVTTEEVIGWGPAVGAYRSC